MLGKFKFKRVLFILIVKCFNKHTNHILSENPSSLPIILRLRFQIVVLLFYIANYKELLRVCFSGFHTVSHDMLSDYVSFHSIYIEESLHKSDSLYFFIGGNSGIVTWNYT